MNSFEKVQYAYDLKPYQNRQDIPLYPMMLLYPGVVAGMTQKEITTDLDKFLKALAITYDAVGAPDLAQSSCPGDTMFVMGLESLRPGFELDDNSSYQFKESVRMEVSDYQKIIDGGFFPWYNNYLCSIQHPPITSMKSMKIGMRWMKLGMNCGKVAKFLVSRGVCPISGTASGLPFDTLSMVRSFGEFVYDLYDEPDLVKAAIQKATPEHIDNIMNSLKHSPLKRVSFYAMRSDASSISPDIFEEFSWPSMKEIFLDLIQKEIQIVLHADGNWLPMLPKLLELPKGKVLVELDGVTDIHAAYDILKGWQAIKGDVPATLMAMGTPDQVHAYCEDLIQMAMGGGFVVGSGCEIPLNCKLENLKAMMDSVRK